MMIISRLGVVIPLILMCQHVWAHPTSFKGSVGVMGSHASFLSHNQLNYSFKHWWAVGVHHFRRPNLLEPRHATLLSTNFLLKRWNTGSYQANLYGVVGAGQSEMSGQPEAVGLGLLQFDIEDRHYYFLAKHLEIRNDHDFELRQTTARVGVAPYVGGFDDIHSWLILEWMANDFNQGVPMQEVTPYLRVFYQSILFEIGQSFTGVTRFNYISHF